MKLTVFRSDKGDCLLASSKKRHVLVDGGMRSSYSEHVAPRLAKLRARGEKLDLVYVSHIDQDHISGVLRLVDDEVDWRVHDFQVKSGNTGHRAPESPRPPKIRAFWHNAFHEQVGKNAGPIEDMLAAAATVLSGDERPDMRELAQSCRDLAASKREAIQLSRRIGARQLDIPLNPEYDGGLMYVSDPAEKLRVGTLRLTVIGPFEEDLRKLRSEWNKWLKKNAKALETIRRKARADEDRLGQSEGELLLGPLLAQARELGDRGSVTTPNLASIMVLLEEGGRTVLLTGDGHWQDVLDGLANAGRLDASGGLHVNVLKVPHHGSEHNTHPEFCRAVTADRYVFCGNGAHANPDLDVIEAYAASRIGKPAERSGNAEVGRRFELVFNAHSSVVSSKHRSHMKKVEALVEKLRKKSGGKLRARFLKRSYLGFTV